MKRKDQIKEILDRFDWSRVRQTMEALGWIWIGPGAVTSIKEIKKQAESLLLDAWRLSKENGGVRCCTTNRGLEAACQDKKLELHFVVASWWID